MFSNLYSKFYNIFAIIHNLHSKKCAKLNLVPQSNYCDFFLKLDKVCKV